MKKKEIVINQCHGNFGLSRRAFLRLRELGCGTALREPDYGEPWPDNPRTKREKFLGEQFCVTIPRDDPHLIQVVRELGKQACGMDANLHIVEVFDGWTIREDDGFEEITTP